jgi:hypothetical protein
VTEPGTFDACELFRALARHDVQYVVVGGIAIQAYGGQRLTQGLDGRPQDLADVKLLESLDDLP